MDNIISYISEIEQQYKITFLLVIKYGSLIWEMDCKHFCYNIKGIYLNKYYKYTIKDVPDNFTISYNSLYNFECWDIKKALQALAKSDPVIIEWLQSHIIYKEGRYINRIRELVINTNHTFNILKYNREIIIKNYHNNKNYINIIRAAINIQWLLSKEKLAPIVLKDAVKQLSDKVYIESPWEQADTILSLDKIASQRRNLLLSIINSKQQELIKFSDYSAIDNWANNIASIVEHLTPPELYEQNCNILYDELDALYDEIMVYVHEINVMKHWFT